MFIKQMLIVGLLVVLLVPHPVFAFSFSFVEQYNYNSYEPAGFFSGLWHGLLAPWTLLVRLLSPFNPTFDISMYAYSNTGWFYDLGFLIGILGSIPIGWLAAIIAFIVVVI